MGKFTLKKRRANGKAPEKSSSRVLRAKTSTASIVYFSYEKQNFGVASNVRSPFPSSDVTRLKFHSGKNIISANRAGVIESGIDSIQVIKNIRNPAASFSISLFPNNNWKKILRPGDWILIFMYSDSNGKVKEGGAVTTGTKDCVLIGNIDRVSRIKDKNEDNDETTLRYKISGSNFGKVFEKTEIWFDPYTNQQETTEVTLQLAGLPITGSPDEITKSLLKIFLGDGDKIPGGDKTTKPLNQWKIPFQLSVWVNSGKSPGGDRFYDILDTSGIEEGLPGYKDRQMIGVGKGGNLWESLTRSSNKIVNEVYIDESRQDDYSIKPKIFLRPRPYNTPFFDSQFGSEINLKSKLKGKHVSLRELARTNFIEISDQEILYEDLGFDEHSRFNMFWMEPRGYASELQAIYSNINKNAGVGLPMVIRESIERYGLRRFDQVLDFSHTAKIGASDANSEYDLFGAFMTQVYDFYYANHLYEQGTIETTGVIEAELGTALIVSNESDETLDKVYYIEGYEHNFRYPNTWTTKFTLTRGQFLNGTRVFIDTSDRSDFGKVDSDIEKYLAKTEVRK